MKDETKLLKAKSRQELAKEYGICARTLKRRLDKHSITLPPGLVLPSFVRKIYQIFGKPSNR